MTTRNRPPGDVRRSVQLARAVKSDDQVAARKLADAILKKQAAIDTERDARRADDRRRGS